MSLEKKPVTVHFFAMDADDSVVRKLVSTFRSFLRLGARTDVVNLPQGRYLINCISCKPNTVPFLFWSAIKERNTWQVRAKHDGTLGSLHDANSIVGDPSFYMFASDKNVLAAFTTYPSAGYLKAMCGSTIRRLLPQTVAFSLDYLSDDQKVSQARKWDYYSRIAIKLDTTGITEHEEKPDIIKALLGIRDAFGGTTISVTLDGGRERLPKQDVTEAINYLSSTDSCLSLTLAGGMFDEEEKTLPINLKKAFVRYHTVLELRPDQKYIGATEAERILSDAYVNTSLPPSNT